jgi:N-acetyl-anhydromuramyl-L-alanine amidase AmpD
MEDWFSWARSGTLRAAADYTINGGVLSVEDANTALDALRDESVEHIKALVGEDFYAQYFPTTRVGGQWSAGNPVGLVDHYTAGISARRTLRWFSNMPRGPESGSSSAHVVAPRDGMLLVLADPREVITWHATWANKSHLGVEHVNAGLLGKTPTGGIVYQGKHPYPFDRMEQIQEIDDQLWEPYTCAQVVSNIVFKRWLIAAIPTLLSDNFVDHEVIDPKRKKDCGPLWPLYAINDLAFSHVPFRDFMSLQSEILTQVGVLEFRRDVKDALSFAVRPGQNPGPDLLK